MNNKLLSHTKLVEYIIYSIKIFIAGMAMQFFIHTIVVYAFWIPDSWLRGWIRAWKELLILIIWVIAILLFYNNKHDIEKWWEISKYSLIIIGSIIIWFIISLGNSLLIHHQSIVTFIMSAKFTYFPLIIFAVAYLIGFFLQENQKDEILSYIVKVIKITLIFWAVRYIILNTIPNWLDWIWYAQPWSSIEWTANTPPPSLWLTNFYSGFVRNQGPFWWPLSFGFYLACLRPLFYIKVLYKKKFNLTRWRRLLYISMIISTFSRAARVMFIIISWLLALIIYKKYAKYIILSWISVVVLIWSYIQLWWKSEIFLRTRSDSWHRTFITQWVKLVKDNRLRWLWAGKVWPASYHIPEEKAFNPENQYMQIRLEYGLFWLLSRLFIYYIIAKKSIKEYYIHWKQNTVLSEDWLLSLIPWLWIIWLWIANIVLHPMTDSSSMYPFMVICWIVFHYNNSSFLGAIKKEEENIIWDSNFWKYFRYIITLFLILCWISFVSQTIIVYGLHIWDTLSISMIRDSIFFSWIIYSLYRYYKYIWKFIKEYKYILLGITILLLISLYHIIGFSWLDNNILSIIAGIKFDIQYLIILSCGLRMGYIIQVNNQWENLKRFVNYMLLFIIFLIVWGVLWQLGKNVIPSLFINYLGMSLPKDFVPFTNPPIYYITWPNWLQRLSWLFVWPNTLGFLLLGFFSTLLYYINTYKKKLYTICFIILYIIITIWTFSRWAILGLAIQSIIVILITTSNKTIKDHYPIIKKIIYIVLITTSLSITLLVINQWKTTSNNERSSSLHEVTKFIVNRPLLWNWPGYSWPGNHYKSTYISNPKNPLSMIENIYLQILINNWIIWLWGWWLIRIILWIYHFRIYKHSTEKDEIYYYSITLWIWLSSLLIIGIFLHVFIDSIVNYLFFLIYGIIIAFNKNRNNQT